MCPYTALKAVEGIRKGGAEAARPEQGGLAPSGAQFKRMDLQFLKGKDLIEALVEKYLPPTVSERTAQMVKYAVGLAYLADTEDEDAEMALRIVQQIVADLSDIAQDSLRFAKRIIEQLKWARILIEVRE
jgi:hypothetical protein